MKQRNYMLKQVFPMYVGGVILLLHCLNIKLDSVPHVNGGDYLEKLKK